VRSAVAWAAREVGPVQVVRPLVGGLVSTTLLLASGRGDLVLRVLDRDPGRAEAPERLPVEVAVLGALQGSGLPVPQPVAVDPTGRSAGAPALLMTRLPGVLRLDPPAPARLRAVAEALVLLHALDPPPEAPPHVPLHVPPDPPAPPAVPAWTADRQAWERALQALREEPPPYRSVLLHRDAHPGNLLWDGDRLTGVVDWAGACTGPPALDVAHCAVDLALLHGPEAADALREAYAGAGGHPGERAAWWDLADAAGLPDPAALAPPWRLLGRGDLGDDVLRARLDAYVRQRAWAM
jgi:aminoglycoside phosphotransferase (APT) family kinase protein